MRLWIDTDVGSDVDDALAIAYALRHPQLELVGLSTVFGDVALRTRIARALLELAGTADVPVLTGLGAPLTPGRVGRMFGHEGLGLLDEVKPYMTTESDSDGAARIERLARAVQDARPDALIAIGPLTNLAALARAGHSLPPVTMMGGKIQDVILPGMIPQIPEWNWWCDPRAVAEVLAAPQAAPPRIVPAEVTFRTLLPNDQWARLASGDDLAKMLAVLCEHWLRAQRERLAAKTPCVMLHDPLAVASLVEPGLTAFAPARIRVDDAAVTHHVPDAAAVEVAYEVDVAALRAHLLEIWLG